MRLRMTVEYDGTHFSGWQIQSNGRSVQEAIESALRELTAEKVSVISSGRTDAGVHAKGMTIHFNIGSQLPLRAYRDGMNRLLPDDVAIVDVREIDEKFHARFSAIGKWYRYSLCTRKIRPVIERDYCWHVRKKLDLEVMRQTADVLLGEHDFASFKVSDCDAKTSTRRIDRINIVHEGDMLHVDIVGSGFLRYMVRRLVGTLIEAASGRRTIQSVEELVSRPGVSQAGATAPARGLCLMQVLYPGEDLDFWENFP